MPFEGMVKLAVDGYDLAAERQRTASNRTRQSGQPSANASFSRDSAVIEVRGDLIEDPNDATAGPFVRCAMGTYFDTDLRQGHRLIERPPTADADDRATAASPREALESLVRSQVQHAFPNRSFDSLEFFATSARAHSVAVAHARRLACARIRTRHGQSVLDRVTREAAQRSSEFPATVLEVAGATHRALGDWSRSIPFQCDVEELRAMIDPRSLPEILAATGGLLAVLEAGLVPVELCAALFVEGMQVESGGRIAARSWLRALNEFAREHEFSFAVDESRTFARTGSTFFSEQLGLAPNLLVLGGAAGVGMVLARDEVERENGHSSSFGSEDESLRLRSALEVWQRWCEGRDPLFSGLSYAQNLRVKGEYLRTGLASLAQRHPETLLEFCGLGGVFSLTVLHREELIREGWRRGIRLAPSGAEGEVSALRLLLLADVRTREIDLLMDALDRLLSVMDSTESVLGGEEEPGP